MPHSKINNQQKSRARQLRRTMTRAETLLWRYLKAHRVDGLGFRRQAPMGPYIADFVCHSARVAVELDGSSHDFLSSQQRDQARDGWFEARGFAVLRFANEDVMRHLEGVVEMIRATASQRAAVTPLPVPPPQGGRER